MPLNGRRPEFIVPQEGLPPQQAAGFIIWLTGLSGAGKTTLANALRERLAGCGRLEVLDGDEMRTTLCRGLGFSREDRDANVFRIGYVAKLLARHGVVTIVSAISPYRDARDQIRRAAIEQGIPFVEVYLDVPLETLIARDVKGLYRKALAGELAHFTGVSDPYEAPLQPDVVIHTNREPVDASAETILDVLAGRGLLLRLDTDRSAAPIRRDAIGAAAATS
jgi:adenylylsulfate kinase